MDKKTVDTIEHICEKAFLETCSELLKDSEGLINVEKLFDEAILKKFLSLMDKKLSNLYNFIPNADELIEFLHSFIIRNRNDIMQLSIYREVRTWLS